MTIEFHWYDAAHTIMRVQYRDRWTWDEYVSVFAEVDAAVALEAHGVYVIHVSDNGFKIIPEGLALPSLKHVSEHRSEHLLASFIVIEAAFSRNLADMMFKVLPAYRRGPPHVFVNSLEEALAKIAQTPSG